MTTLSGELSWGQLLQEVASILGANPLVRERGTAEPEAITLVCGALERFKKSRERVESPGSPKLPEATRSGLWWAAQEPAPVEVVTLARGWARERAQGKLLQHLTGEQAFLDHVYEVSPEVLVPRPETEGLLVLALELLSEESGGGWPVRLGLELGLGSGVLSTELLAARTDLRMIASEVSAGARAVAARNVRRILGDAAIPGRLEVLAVQDPTEILGPFVSWSARTGAQADFLISNPPYLSEEAGEETDFEVRTQEPRGALFPDPRLADPLAFYRAFASGLHSCLREGGLVILELAAERALETAELFTGWNDVRLHPDLTGKHRFLSARRAKSELGLENQTASGEEGNHG